MEAEKKYAIFRNVSTSSFLIKEQIKLPIDIKRKGLINLKLLRNGLIKTNSITTLNKKICCGLTKFVFIKNKKYTR